MDFRVLLVQSIALLYWESTLPNLGFNSKQLIQDIIKGLPSPDSIAGTDDDRENLAALRGICLNMATVEEAMDKEFLENKVKLYIKKDPELRQDVIDALRLDNMSEEGIILRIKALQRELDTWLYQKSIKEEIKKIAAKTIFAGAPNFEVSKMAKDIIATMERFVNSTTNDEEDPVLNGKGEVDNIDEMVKHFTNVQEDLSPDSVLKTGWQGLNRMFGEVGGLRRGNMYVVGALPSKGKSLVSSCVTLQVGMYNTPYMFDQTKKPAIVHISTENDIPLNLKIWFRYLWENETGEPCNIQDMDPEAMAVWFKNTVQRNGYQYFFYHIDPTNTTYHDILNRLLSIESKGYEIHLCTIDYLAMINGDGLGDENRAFWVRQLFKVLRNHCNPRRITLLTPHQVATDAAALLRQGSTDFVKQIAGKRYWADSRSIDMEVDCEIVLNVELDGNNQPWMAFGRGKDRTSQTTPEKDKFFFLPFNQVGGLRIDINGNDTSKRNIRNNDSLSLDGSGWGEQQEEY